MDPISAVHNAARRYCIERTTHWQRACGELQASGRARDTTHAGEGNYSPDLNLSSRYNVLGAILSDVERFTPSEFSTVEDARNWLAACGESAQNMFTPKVPEPAAMAAMLEERRLFTAYIRSVEITALLALDPLPFRRVLTAVEHKHNLDNFEKTWGKWYGGSSDKSSNLPHATLHVQAMETPNAYVSLRSALQTHGVSRLIELREWGDSVEQDLSLATFCYNGAEGFWFQSDLTWMVQASHEWSITFGGAWLIDAMKAALPDFDRFKYVGWDLSLY